ncbi:CHAT domain-containing protein (plasmid) [Photobacterium sp. GJ3]|uniref:CHAT domain-containing protein n=1 Tax=Photobacterium sp. GJ3 TaxID=2829502 RepID=UPI001B8CA151|nr:CHAT domain-containing protein [Photobacterium sp. GJ3]QUJ69248.1 CHAT domain-containing protein [Photobacterium sp. GJ3]
MAAELETFTSLDALRSAIKKRILAKEPFINALFSAVASGTIAGLLTTQWRHVTPFLLNAGWFIANQGFKGTKIYSDVTANSAELTAELIRRLSLIQTLSWFALRESWASENEEGRNFENDLSRYISSDMILPNAVDTFIQFVTSHTDEGDVITKYCRQAVTASVCDAAQVENPHRSRWAGAFFDFELLVQCASNSDASLDQLRARQVSTDRARSTITYEDAWKNVSARLASKDPTWPQILGAVAKRCGYPDVISDATNHGIRVHVDGPLSQSSSVKDILDVLKEVALDPEKRHNFILVLEHFLHKLVAESKVDDLVSLSQELTQLVVGSDSAKANLYATLGECFKNLRTPHPFLALIGSTHAPWEETLDPNDRAPLWNERANALRLTGQTAEALWWIDEILRVDGDSLPPKLFRVALLNRAILLREIGAADSAHAALLMLSEDVENPAEKIQILISLGVTKLSLGWYEDARAVLEEARQHATPPWDSSALHIVALLAMVSALTGDVEGAVDSILGYSSSRESESNSESNDVWQNRMSQAEVDYETVVVASVLGMVAKVADRQAPKLAPVFDEIVPNLCDVRQRAEARGDVPLVLDVLRVEASLTDYDSSDRFECAWKACYEAHEKHDKSQVAEVLIALAHAAYGRGAVPEAREKLMAVPTALANEFGGAIDLGTTVLGPRRLEYQLNELVRLVRSKYGLASSCEDIRLIAELKRNAVTHAMQRRRAVEQGGRQQIFLNQIEDALAQLSASSGPLAVLEWIDDGESTSHLLTATAKDGTIHSKWLAAPCVDDAEVGRRLEQRLSNWRPSRNGDPFDIEGWRLLEEWLNESLSEAISDEHHVVIIDSRGSQSLPWHVAIAPSRSVSYASSWTELIRLSNSRNKPVTWSIGVALVPRFRESLTIISAFEESVRRSETYAIANDIGFRNCTGVECDRSAFSDLLAGCTVGKILCHGYIDRKLGEVAFMLSHNGALPLADSVAAGGHGFEGHRMSWRACQVLVNVPRVLFSIACSTGVSHTVGLGDRLGLLNAFRWGGGQALVAPRWDVIVPLVLPIMDAAFEEYLQGNHSLAEAVRHACLAAVNSQPRWVSWALSIEGDWR